KLVALIEVKAVDLVLSADLDRLSRGFRPFVRFYEACEAARITVAWLGGQANFATGEGLLELELRASFAREELRKIRARVARMLLRPRYIGQREHQGATYPAAWPAILSEPDQIKLRSILTNKKHSIPGRRPAHLLSGVLRCGACGKPMKWAGASKRNKP